MVSRNMGDYYDTTCHAIDPDTVIVQGMRFVKEQTCEIERTEQDEFGIYDHLSCGHVAMRQWQEKTHYCPNCGAKVVSDV